MGSFVVANANTPGAATAVAVAGPLPTVQDGDRIYVVVSSGAANPNTITDPTTAAFVKLDEWAPDGTFKSAAYYLDVTAANAAALSGSSHTWTFQTSARTTAQWAVYRGVDQTRVPVFGRASGVADSVAATTVPAITSAVDSWQAFAVAARQSPGTDTAKTWTIGGFSTDVERVEQYATNVGTGQKLSVAWYDTNGPASAGTPVTGGGGGGGTPTTITVTDARPVNTFNNICLNSSARIGATLDRATLDIWKPRLLKNGWMRVFPDQDKLPPDWEDSRLAYCRAVGAHPFVSSKLWGDTTKIQQLFDWFKDMKSWILDDPDMLIWYVEHHEPEKEYVEKYGSKASGASHYITNYRAVWNKLATLPSNIRAKIRMGPALTKQWTEVASKGNFDYQLFDPGAAYRQFKGYDSYVDSGSLASSSSVYPNPATWLQYIKADNAGGQPKIQVELGAINKVGDDTGAGRAAFLQGLHDEMSTWPDYGGLVWWCDHGTPSSVSINNIGTERYFELDLRYAGENKPTALPKVTTTITTGGTTGGGGGGGSTARTVTPNLAQANVHVWSFSVPMPAPAPPAEVNAWSYLGLPQR